MHSQIRISICIRRYRLAAEQGLPDAQFNLGVCYANGVGAALERPEAVRWRRRWRRRGGGRGSRVARTPPSCLRRRRDVHARTRAGVPGAGAQVRWWRRAAEGGLVEAAYNLGMAYAAARAALH